MSDIIHLLPDAVANQIAAGEVIQRPASVLKELVENAIDAEASCIQIVIRDAGRTLLQVTDDGKGMSESDARMAFERHATSKIKDASDLFSIRTMGFRGEALASIASVAQVEMKTKRNEDELGTLIEIAGSRLFKQEQIQCQQGTTFMVKNLFFNVPARRRFLKSDNVEKNHILNEFYRIVLVHPDVEFHFFDGDEEIYHLPVAPVKMRIEQVFQHTKKRIGQMLLKIETDTAVVNIRGYVGRPEAAQKSAQQFFFVNGRYMRHPYFHKAVALAYNQLIQSTDNPLYFIYFEVDPQSIDINIHPTKTEIKFENEQTIWSILSAAVKEALGKFNVVPSIDFDREGVPELPVLNRDMPIQQPKVEFNPAYNPFGQSTYKRPAVDWQDLYQGFEKKQEPDFPSEQSFFPQTEVIQSKMNIPVEEHAGNYFQLKNKYIISSVKSGMLIIDQRRAHIRILFEQYLNEIKHKKGYSQQLLFPESLMLMPGDELIFSQIKPDLKYAGFCFEEVDGKYMITGAPSVLQSTGDLTTLIHEMVEKAHQMTGDVMENMQEKIAMSLAEASAIHAGQFLSDDAMKDLIDRLFSCPVHQHTPDGKQIMRILGLEEIGQWF
jgi:DNA mismatch repair protein MutL